MAQGPMIGTITVKIVKAAITIILLFLYRTGYAGQFLGVGAVWNFNEEKNVDVEILASGVFVGFFIYNLSVLITYCISSERSANDCLMNLIGIFLWTGVAGTALHYWHGFQNEHGNEYKSTEKDIGMAVGSLCVLNAAAHLIDAVITFKLFNENGDSHFFSSY
ncbi:hypothetical protein RUM43_004822 [Polyplax serrata]|uniref:Uncharacterized protein n=1 Tax=Polyplax serrata TaxID=468196 RepID=A0AAN8XQL4_POLSC